MNTISRTGAFIASAGIVMASLVAVTPAEAHKTGIHDNCTKFNKKYPHGVGRRGANDKGGSVTNFKRSNKIYNKAERHNGDLDGTTIRLRARRPDHRLYLDA